MSQPETQPDCQRTIEGLNRALFTAEEPSAADQLFFDTHLNACDSCRAEYTLLRETHALLSDSVSTSTAPSSLLPKIVARLPQTVPAPAKSGALKVVAVGARSSSPWRMAFISAAAAAVAVVVGLAFIRQTSNVAQVSRGNIVDASGKTAKTLVAGTTYTVKEEAVVPLGNSAMLRLTEGAQFAVQSGAPGMVLERGDVYTVGKEKQKPTRVVSQSFQADLQQGDFFVSADDAGDPRGVLIVFDGMATVSPTDTPLEVPGGHVFVSVKNADAFSELLSMAEVLERLHQDVSIQGVNSASVREEYARKVAGYDKELQDLANAVNTENDPDKKAELQERRERVQQYRTQHHKRLKSLRNEFPSDQIRRGLDRHLPPERWM